MPGTLTITTLSDGTNSTSATNCIQGSAKAWVNFNATGGVIAIRASFGISSITIPATGTYTINFTSAFSDTNYMPVVATSPAYGTTMLYVNLNASGAGIVEVAPTTTSMTMLTYGPTVANFNAKYISAAFFR